MADERSTPSTSVPEARTLSRRRTRISLVWVIPIIAALVGVCVAVTRIESQGPEITIAFESAEGLEAGKPKIEYKGVEVGTITSIELAPDHQRVLTTAQMAPKTEEFLSCQTPVELTGWRECLCPPDSRLQRCRPCGVPIVVLVRVAY
jgi:paraquat-inducible protein B